MKLFTLFINTIYWIWLVVVPLIPATILGIWLYDRSPDNVPIIVLVGVVALILGIIFAEYVRKSQGLMTFFSKIISSEDLPDNSKEAQKK